jgi:hypothetical protein
MLPLRLHGRHGSRATLGDGRLDAGEVAVALGLGQHGDALVHHQALQPPLLQRVGLLFEPLPARQTGFGRDTVCAVVTGRVAELVVG